MKPPRPRRYIILAVILYPVTFALFCIGYVGFILYACCSSGWITSENDMLAWFEHKDKTTTSTGRNSQL